MNRARDEARTEAPTRRRRREARRDGQVASSALLVAAAALAAGGGTIVWLSGELEDRFGAALREGLGRGRAVQPEELGTVGLGLATQLVEPGLITLAAIAVAACLAALVQVRPLFTLRPLRPDWSRLGLTAGWRQLWSPTARLARWRALVGSAALLVPGVLIGASALPDLANLPYVDTARGAAALGVLLERWLVASVLVLLALGLVDWAWQRRLLTAQLRMSRREVEDERRETEGPRAHQGEQRRRWDAGGGPPDR